MGRIGPLEIVLILLVVLLLFGAKRLPEIFKSLGSSIREFKKAQKDDQDSSTHNPQS
ncbi:MAG: twin-arginine translocase TatA/TatE family subunit [Candidatus Omnitrophica bacterium]|nr:twin-arginine translocase TatA/TatE family subunit [Candidatus Omnitrophota bacterium]